MTVPPANPPERKDDNNARRFFLFNGERLDGSVRDQVIIGAMALLYQSMKRKFNPAAPPCLRMLGVFPFNQIRRTENDAFFNFISFKIC